MAKICSYCNKKLRFGEDFDYKGEIVCYECGKKLNSGDISEHIEKVEKPKMKAWKFDVILLVGVIIIIIIVASFFILTNEKGKFIGTWQNGTEGSITFNSDNTAIIDGVRDPFGFFSELNGTVNYNIANQQVTFTNGNVSVTLGYKFQDKNTYQNEIELHLSNKGYEIFLTKV